MASYGGGGQNWHGQNDPPWRGSRGKRRGFRGKNPYRWHPDNQTPQGEHKNVSNLAFYQLLFMSLVPKFWNSRLNKEFIISEYFINIKLAYQCNSKWKLFSYGYLYIDDDEFGGDGYGRRNQPQGRGRGRGGHPSGLKGREIGLFYAKKSREKAKSLEIQHVSYTNSNLIEQISVQKYIWWQSSVTTSIQRFLKFRTNMCLRLYGMRDNVIVIKNCFIKNLK